MSEPERFSLQEIFARYARELSTFIKWRWPGEQDIADIVQETFLRLAQYPQPETIRDPRAFLFQTAANLTVDRHRRQTTRERHTVADVDIEAIGGNLRATPEHYWESREALDRFVALLDELPEVCRHAFVLYRIEGFSHAEVAAHLGISVRSSERHVMRAMRHFAKRFDDDR